RRPDSGSSCRRAATGPRTAHPSPPPGPVPAPRSVRTPRRRWPSRGMYAHTSGVSRRGAAFVRDSGAFAMRAMHLACVAKAGLDVSAILLRRPFDPPPESRVPRFYITTAIDYVNGRPHLGHAYEKVLADAIARRHRQKGDATYYLTGTDEHGQKIARAAAAAGKTPAAFVDELSQTFVQAWRTLDIQYDQFFRTTDQRHRLAVQELFRRLKHCLSPKSGQPVLYEEAYEGLYCEGCESFKTDKDLDDQGRCPEHKVKPKPVKESNFFFRLSEYDEVLLKHIEAHPDFIWPDYRRNEVVNVIKGGLQDISVSRPNLAWGIPLPDDIPGSEGHVAYVWADALLNYLSALGWPERKYSLWWLAQPKAARAP